MTEKITRFRVDISYSTSAGHSSKVGIQNKEDPVDGIVFAIDELSRIAHLAGVGGKAMDAFNDAKRRVGEFLQKEGAAPDAKGGVMECREELRLQGMPYPRSCDICGPQACKKTSITRVKELEARIAALEADLNAHKIASNEREEMLRDSLDSARQCLFDYEIDWKDPNAIECKDGE